MKTVESAALVSDITLHLTTVSSGDSPGRECVVLRGSRARIITSFAGNRADYWHCGKCGSCYTVASRATHKCVDRALHSDCPVCMEYLFTSVRMTHAQSSHQSCQHCVSSSAARVGRRSDDYDLTFDFIANCIPVACRWNHASSAHTADTQCTRAAASST